MSDTKQIPTKDDLVGMYETTSARIRHLNSLGVTKYRISKILDIRYQWVRNVLITKVTNPKEQIRS